MWFTKRRCTKCCAIAIILTLQLALVQAAAPKPKFSSKEEEKRYLRQETEQMKIVGRTVIQNLLRDIAEVEQSNGGFQELLERVKTRLKSEQKKLAQRNRISLDDTRSTTNHCASLGHDAGLQASERPSPIKRTYDIIGRAEIRDKIFTKERFPLMFTPTAGDVYYNCGRFIGAWNYKCPTADELVAAVNIIMKKYKTMWLRNIRKDMPYNVWCCRNWADLFRTLCSVEMTDGSCPWAVGVVYSVRCKGCYFNNEKGQNHVFNVVIMRETGEDVRRVKLCYLDPQFLLGIVFVEKRDITLDDIFRIRPDQVGAISTVHFL